jgi:hypothetical protein
MTSSMRNSGLPTGQIAMLVIFGAVLWFAAAMLTRFLVPMPFYDGWGIALVYALVIPGTVPFVMMARPLARLRVDQTAMGITIVTATALLLDGTAFAFFPSLYANNAPDAAQAAAAILWGAGVALVLAMVMNKGENA